VIVHGFAYNLDCLKKNVCTVIVGMQIKSSRVIHASKPPEISFQVGGYEEIQDGHRINVDYLNMESNTACRKNVDGTVLFLTW
jgi:hypothetical protein